MKKHSSGEERSTRRKTLQKVLIIGMGNEYRGNDGVGVVIARALREKLAGSVVIKVASGEGAALIEAWQGYERVILIDAISSGATQGTIFKLDVRKKKVPANFFHTSSHAFGLAEAIELSRVMNTLPHEFLVYGIEGGTFHAGRTLSRSVQQSAQNVVRQIIKFIDGAGR
jgi:hydrogenase maturation protease